MKRSHQILFIAITFGIGIVAILIGSFMYLNTGSPQMIPLPDKAQKSPPVTVPLQPSPTEPVPVTGNSVSIQTVDIDTGQALGGVSVYLDGGYEGMSLEMGAVGSFNLTGVPDGSHTIRVTKSGYADFTQPIVLPSSVVVKIGLKAQILVPVQEKGAHDSKIDIVFIPSSTSYNCAENKKITSTAYVTDRTAFVNDVNSMVDKSLFTLDSVTDKNEPIPADYKDRFNIYYYYDRSNFADAFNGCAGKVPEKFWRDVPFADVVVILYPTYYTLDTGSPCEPNGCVNPGTGRSWMKIPADQKVLFLHESGHAIFGLIDTYCGTTEYWQNDPDPNVWSSSESCVKDAKDTGRDPSGCRQIQQRNPTACVKPYWRWDPDPDIMHEGYFGNFGKASTERISYTFNNINAWGKKP